MQHLIQRYQSYHQELVLNILHTHHVLGVQGSLWTEHVQDAWHAEMMLYPRVFAIAETGWSQAEKKNWPDFEQRASVLAKVARGWGYTVYPPLTQQ